MIVDVIPTTHESVAQDPIIDVVGTEAEGTPAVVRVDVNGEIFGRDFHPIASVKHLKSSHLGNFTARVSEIPAGIRLNVVGLAQQGVPN